MGSRQRFTEIEGTDAALQANKMAQATRLLPPAHLLAPAAPRGPPTRNLSGPANIRSSSNVRRRHSSQSGSNPRILASPKPLNTHSPVALAAAAAVTPRKIAKLLGTQGPLAIRHITAHLASTIPGFADLSLSKQRRLIIAVLDNGDKAEGIQFEKVGWGRWAVRTSARTSSMSENGKPQVESADADVLSTSAVLSRPAKLRSFSESTSPLPSIRRALADAERRASMTRALPGSKMPLSPLLAAVSISPEEDAVFSDSEDEEHQNTDEEDWRVLRADPLKPTSREQEAIAALVQLRSI